MNILIMLSNFINTYISGNEIEAVQFFDIKNAKFKRSY